MDLHDILSRLRGVKGPSGAGEYTARCPAHDDKQASLCLRAGNKGIVLKCQAGCSFDAVCRALGVEPKDLFFELSDAHTPMRRKAETSADMKVHTARQFTSYEAAYGRLGRIENIYPYTDENGALLFEVARIRMADGKKTFRQHRPVLPQQGALPFICNVPPEIRNTALYRLPDVQTAIRSGQAVYVVEGEKDADTIASMGLCGTTNAGGAGKWTKWHSAYLTGADVIIIPDEDPESNGHAGQKHGETVARMTQGIAKSVKLIRLKDAYPDLPEKGDISDLCACVGMERAKEMLDELVAKTQPMEESLYSQAVAAYNALPGICVDNGCVAQRLKSKKEDGEEQKTAVSTRVMGTFVALPTRQILKDDGVQSVLWLEILGWNRYGQPLPPLMVNRTKFTSMDWIGGWPLDAIIMSGNGLKDRLRCAIELVGFQLTKRETMYTHYGWRKFPSGWCYLYQGGSIGQIDATVDLGEGLTNYDLGFYPEDMPKADAAMSSILLSSVIAEKVSVPMLGVTYLAPLREFLATAGCDPAFAVFMYGRTGTRKSTAAALFLSHFGNFTSRSLPASFNDTSNYIRRKAFAIKDAMLVVDDYHPTSSVQERRAMERTAQSLARAFGDLAERGRLGSDLTIQASMPPRSLAVISGEDLPDIGESGISRYYVINVEVDDVPASAELTDLQTRAKNGELRAAMRGYIEWLIPQADRLADELAEMFFSYRARAQELMKNRNVHGRTVEAVAQIMIGLTMMNRYFASLDIYTPEIAALVTEDLWQVVVENSIKQTETSRDEKPSAMFIRAVRELLASKGATVVDISPGAGSIAPGQNMIGYCDAEYYYLLGDVSYGAVVRFYREQERLFPINRNALCKELVAEGYIEDLEKGRAQKMKRVGGKTYRLLWIRRVWVDGDRPFTPKQQKMDFAPVEDIEIPDELDT